MFLFNLLSNYKVNEANKDNLINIFTEKEIKYSLLLKNDEWNKYNYFFILDNNKKIVKIKPFSLIFKNMASLLMKLKQSKKTGDDTPFFKKKEKAQKEKLKQAEELIQFISNIPKMNLNYIFDIVFKISLILNPNDELTDLRIKKINRIDIEAEFFTKEYKYLNQLCDSLKLSNCKFELTELKTIDVDIDFTNMECGKCKNVIPDNAYLYYCYICKIKYCWNCVQDKLKKNKGKGKYIDEKHHLLFFKTRDKNQFLNLEESKLGHNRFTEFDENKLSNYTPVYILSELNGIKQPFIITSFLTFSKSMSRPPLNQDVADSHNWMMQKHPWTTITHNRQNQFPLWLRITMNRTNTTKSLRCHTRTFGNTNIRISRNSFTIRTKFVSRFPDMMMTTTVYFHNLSYCFSLFAAFPFYLHNNPLPFFPSNYTIPKTIH